MNPKVTFKISTGGRWINASAEGTVTDEQVRGILAAAGHPELAQEGTGRAWRITRPGWHVFTYQGAIRVDWWSEHTLGNDYAARQGDRDGLASLRATLEAAGLTVTAPDESVLELAPQPVIAASRLRPGHTEASAGQLNAARGPGRRADRC